MLYHSPNMKLGGFAYTTVESVEIQLICIFPIHCMWYSGRAILSYLFLYRVCAIWEQPHNMWGTISWSFDRIRTYSAISFINALLQLFFPVRLGIDQLLSYRYVNRRDYVRYVLSTLEYLIRRRSNLWVLSVLVYIFPYPGLFHYFGLPLLLSGFSLDFFDVTWLFSSDHCYLVGVTKNCEFFIKLVVI